ncbi:MAG: thioredoxin-dependent thiol peroxidase [Rhodothermaceae bacterium]|nr:thioredoxin-dependent thiol peroxidase [Rhodothermaceae bacterium]
MPAPGDLAPAFEGIDQTGATVRLADFAGKPLALYFYPKDDTPGCTKQACNLRDHTGDLTEAGVAVVGVSADPVESHERFAAKYDLPFPLLADPEHEILEAYGAWGEKNLYGRKSMGTKRTTFLIGADGRVIHVFKRPKTDRHAEEILAKLPA